MSLRLRRKNRNDRHEKNVMVVAAAEEKVFKSIGCIFLDRQDSFPAGFGSHWVP
jgi:hypothetical protein